MEALVLQMQKNEIFENIIKKLWKKQQFTSLDIANLSGENREEFSKYIEANFTQHFLLKNYKRQLIIEPAEFRSVLSYVKYTKEPLQTFNKTLWKNKRKEYDMDRLQLPLEATSLFNCSRYSHLELEEEILLYPDEKGKYKRWSDGRLVFYPNNVIRSNNTEFTISLFRDLISINPA